MKIGIFDSGVGGLTVLKAIKDIFDKVDIVYLGDTARVPYGNKSKETVQRYSLECADFLIKQSVDFLVVACNTASSYALDTLRENLDIPVIGVVEPGVKLAVEKTKTKHVGIIGTKGTIQSGSYQRALQDYGINTYAKACPLFVPLIEEGLIEGEIVESVVDYYLEELKKTPIDVLILGCTHYPLIKSVIQNYFGDGVKVIDSAHSVAKALDPLIVNEGNSTLDLYFTDNSPIIEDFIRLIFGESIKPYFIPILCSL